MLPFIFGHAAAAKLEVSIVFPRFLYGLRCVGTVAPFAKHLPI
jgi:hypothetical protein